MEKKIEKVRIYNKGKNHFQTAEGELRPERYLDVSPELAKILVRGYKNILYAESMGKDSVPSGPGVAALKKKEAELNLREKRIKEAEGRLGINDPQEPEDPEPPEDPQEPKKPGDESGKKRGRPRK